MSSNPSPSPSSDFTLLPVDQSEVINILNEYILSPDKQGLDKQGLEQLEPLGPHVSTTVTSVARPRTNKPADANTLRLRAENRERKKRWRQANAERNKDNDLRCRVTKRAVKLFGNETSEHKEKWIEEEFGRRKMKRKERTDGGGGEDDEDDEGEAKKPKEDIPYDAIMTLMQLNNGAGASANAAMVAAVQGANVAQRLTSAGLRTGTASTTLADSMVKKEDMSML